MTTHLRAVPQLRMCLDVSPFPTHHTLAIRHSDKFTCIFNIIFNLRLNISDYVIYEHFSTTRLSILSMPSVCMYNEMFKTYRNTRNFGVGDSKAEWRQNVNAVVFLSLHARTT
jgi:hypothetical protein